MDPISLGTVAALGLATIRATTFLLLAPPYSHRGVGARSKAFLGIALGLAVLPRLPVIPVDTGFFIIEAIMQALVGAALGFLISVVWSAVASAGRLIDLFGGFELAQGFDPLLMTQSAQFGRLYTLAGVTLLWVTDGYQIVLLGLARSFDVVPIGSSLDWGAFASTLISQLGALVAAAIQIAGPMIAILFMTDIGLGLLTRVAPALNAFALGFPLKILVTITLMATMLVALPRVVFQLMYQALTITMGVTN